MRPGTPGFTGERLKAARESRGIATATSLAEMIGVTQVAVSQYERGLQTPSPQVMRTICDRLNLPVQYFLKPAPTPAGTLFFRSMASSTKAERTRVSRQFEWLRDITDFVSTALRFPVVDVPMAHVPQDPHRITDEMIDDAAVELRKHWGLGNGPISNVCLLIENKGSVLSQTNMGTERLDAFSHWDNERERPFVILGTEKKSAVRSRANAAHELGHMVLHRHLCDSDLKRASLFKEVERQAFRFASAFLLPADTFLGELYGLSLEAFLEKKERWKTSIAMMLKRCEDLGAIRESQAKNMWITLARRGWRRKEPLDDVIPVERPRFLRRCIEMIIEKGIYDRQSLPIAMSLPETDIERLAGLPSGWLTELNEPQAIEAAEPQIIKFPSQ